MPIVDPFGGIKESERLKIQQQQVGLQQQRIGQEQQRLDIATRTEQRNVEAANKQIGQNVLNRAYKLDQAGMKDEADALLKEHRDKVSLVPGGAEIIGASRSERDSLTEGTKLLQEGKIQEAFGAFEKAGEAGASLLKNYGLEKIKSDFKIAEEKAKIKAKATTGTPKIGAEKERLLKKAAAESATGTPLTESEKETLAKALGTSKVAVQEGMKNARERISGFESAEEVETIFNEEIKRAKEAFGTSEEKPEVLTDGIALDTLKEAQETLEPGFSPDQLKEATRKLLRERGFEI